MRDNPDLDGEFGVGNVNGTELPKQRRRRRPGNRDAVRRRAFRVLALLADLGVKERDAVLKAAHRLSRA